MANINDFGFPFSSATGDRQYSSAEWRQYFGVILTDGVISYSLNGCEVKPQVIPNKTVYVDTGTVFIQGAMRVVDSVQTIAINDNTSGNPRVDRIVARLNFADRKIEFLALQGTPAGSPTAPALTRNTTYWELGLADVSVANGFSTITASEITDTRLNNSLCGYSKTIYMQEFDDENNLLKYRRDVNTTDSGLNPTDVRYYRDDDSLFLKRAYTNPDSNGYYQTITEQFYLANGSTVYKTIVYTLTYLANGIVDTSERVVS